MVMKVQIEEPKSLENIKIPLTDLNETIHKSMPNKQQELWKVHTEQTITNH